MKAEIKISIVCETEGCPNFGRKINEVTGPKKNEDAFYAAYGHGGEDDEDFCPLCKKLGVAKDPEDVKCKEKRSQKGGRKSPKKS